MTSLDGHLFKLLKKRLHSNVVVEMRVGDNKECFLIRRQDLLQVVRFLKFDPDAAMDLLVDIVCVEHIPGTSWSCFWNVSSDMPRIEIVYILFSTRFLAYAHLSLLLGESDLFMPTLTPLHHSADWLEREAWEMFGIEFEGHHAMQHLLLPSGFSMRPLRKSTE